MLVNLSNHPHKKEWSDHQQQVAKDQFGSVLDYPFPPIDPAWDGEAVNQLAKDTLQDILAVYKTEQRLHILVAGEQSFVWYFIKNGLKENINCYIATSNRNTVFNEDGSKTGWFEFVQFRKISIS